MAEFYPDPTQFLRKYGPAMIQIGRIFIFHYLNWQHDKTPMALMLAFEPQYNTYQAVNLHYLPPPARTLLFKLWQPYYNEKNDSWNVGYTQLKMVIPDTSICIRRYKVDKIVNSQRVPSDHAMILSSVGNILDDVREQLWNRTFNEVKTQLKLAEPKG